MKALNRFCRAAKEDIDVLFTASLGRAGRLFLINWKKTGTFALKRFFGVYGKERDEFIARSKLLLNIHYYSAKIFEAVRVSYLSTTVVAWSPRNHRSIRTRA